MEIQPRLTFKFVVVNYHLVKSLEIRYALLFISLLSVGSIFAQKRAALDFDGAPLYRVLDRVEGAFGIKVYYHPDHIPSFETYISRDSLTIFELFQQATAGTSLQLVKYNSSSYIAAPERFQSKKYADEVVEGWETGRYRSPDDQVAPLLRLKQGDGDQQQGPLVFSGKLIDETTKEPLFGVTLYHAQLARGTTSDLDGSFQE